MNSSNTLTRYVAMLMLGAVMLISGLAVMAVRAHADGTTPPVISNILATPSDTGATITWSTDQGATSQVQYGLTTSYNASSTLLTATTTSHTSFLGGLVPGTLYHFQVLSANASGTMATSSDTTFTTTNTASTTTTVATTSPVVSLVASTPTQNGASITWNTNVAANSQALYGTTTSYGNATVLDPANVMSHSVMILGLNSNTLYHFQVLSTGTGSSSMLGTSTDMIFTTLMATSTATTTDTDGSLQGQIDALKARVSILESEIASILAGLGGGGGTTTPPTGSGMLDQSSMTVHAGGALNFGGRGFPHEENLTITLNGATVGMAHADGGGNFSSGSIMAPTTPGTYTYVCTGSTGDVTHATVTVQ